MNGRVLRVALVLAGVITIGPRVLAAEALSLAGHGAGLWVQHARPKMRITRVTATGSGKHLRVEFLLANGTRRMLGGKLAGQSGSAFFMKISHSGNADAHGSLWIETSANNEVRQAYASGTLDGQPFLAQFNGKPPLRFNFLTEGTGSLGHAGSGDARLVGAGLLSDMRLRAELVFFLADGSQRRFTGQVKKQTAKPRTLLVALRNSGEADASGELRVRLTERKGLLSVSGPGKIDGQPFKVEFQATLEPADRAAMMEGRLPALRKVSGEVHKDNAATKYVAWADEAGVRFIDAVIDHGEYGSSHRKMYFEGGKLIYFSEQGQLRSGAATGQMNLVETDIAFAATGKLETSTKLVNGKPVKLGPHDGSGAMSFAEMLRKAAEEKVRGK